MKKNLIILLVILSSSFSCKKEGCTDPKALTYDSEAKKDDGTCEYSSATFYVNKSGYSGYTISNVNVTVNGSSIGNMNTVYYPSGPGNCMANGTLPYQFNDGEAIQWNSTITLSGTTTIVYGSGTVEPDPGNECVKINVAP